MIDQNLLVIPVLQKNKKFKYLINFTFFLGGLIFLFVGVSSYFTYSLIPFLNVSQIKFFPQGITMCFYGLCGIFFGVKQILILFYNIGDGFNEFDKNTGLMTIYRKGKNSDIKIIYLLNDIVCLKKFY